MIIKSDGRWYVGPGNGLFELVQRRAEKVRRWDIAWKPERLSASFHGRDLFAPVAAMIARGEPPPSRGRTTRIAGRSGRTISARSSISTTTAQRHDGAQGRTAFLSAAGRVLMGARPFSDRPPGEAFWYENSNGFAEIAVNRGRADRELGLAVGSPVQIVE